MSALTPSQVFPALDAAIDRLYGVRTVAQDGTQASATVAHTFDAVNDLIDAGNAGGAVMAQRVDDSVLDSADWPLPEPLTLEQQIAALSRINAASERARQEHAELLQFREDSRRPGWPS